MTVPSDTSIDLTGVLPSAAPFHLVVDAVGVVVSAGRTIRRWFVGDPVGQTLDAAFTGLDGTPLVAAPPFERCVGRIVWLVTRTGGIKLRGELVVAGADRFLFCGGPWFDDPEDFGRSNLRLSDFALGDPTLDYLFALQARSAALDDAQTFAQRNLAQREALEAANAELARARAELLEKNVLLERALDTARSAARTKREFLARISHELRTPLNVIVNLPAHLRDDLDSFTVLACPVCGAATEVDAPVSVDPTTPQCRACGEPTRRERLVRHQSPEDEVLGWYDRLETASGHLLRVVEDLLDVSRLEAGTVSIELRDVLADDLVRDVVALTLPLRARLHIELETTVEPGVHMRVDRARVGQILVNLVHNAAQASIAGQSVSLRIGVRAGQVLCAVQDRGHGIPKERLEHIFEAFTQLEEGSTRRRGGSGLGLPIARQLASLHGGSLEVCSSPEDGTVFHLTLGPPTSTGGAPP